MALSVRVICGAPGRRDTGSSPSVSEFPFRAPGLSHQKLCFKISRSGVRARSGGLDVTPAVAQGTARRLLGRGLDARETAALFATPGRTAAHKSCVTARELADPEAVLGAGITRQNGRWSWPTGPNSGARGVEIELDT